MSDWIAFHKDNSATWPIERRCVLVQFAGDDAKGIAPGVAVGYTKMYSDGPFFVTPGVTQHGGITHFCDCLGNDFRAPLWNFPARQHTPPPQESQ